MGLKIGWILGGFEGGWNGSRGLAGLVQIGGCLEIAIHNEPV